MLMKEIRGRSYRFPEMQGEDDAQIKQANSLKYVEHLGQVTGTDVSDWPIEIFLNSNGRVHVDRQDINEKFFEFKAKAAVLPKEVPKVAIKSLKKLESSLMNSLKTRLVNTAHELERAKESLRNLEIRAHGAQQTVFDKTLIVQSLNEAKSRGFDLTKQLEQIMATGYWELSPNPLELQLISPPISLTYFNSLHKRNNCIHLGRLMVSFFPSGDGIMNARITKHSGAAHRSGHCHPHVDSGGSPCFGEIRHHWAEARSTINLVEMCSLLRTLFETYNEDNAFQQLSTFEAKAADPVPAPGENFNIEASDEYEEDPDGEPDEGYDDEPYPEEEEEEDEPTEDENSF